MSEAERHPPTASSTGAGRGTCPPQGKLSPLVGLWPGVFLMCRSLCAPKTLFGRPTCYTLAPVLIASLFKWDFSYKCAAVDKISNDTARHAVPQR